MEFGKIRFTRSAEINAVLSILTYVFISNMHHHLMSVVSIHFITRYRSIIMVATNTIQLSFGVSACGTTSEFEREKGVGIIFCG